MIPSLTPHQWDAVNLSRDWYVEADRNRHVFESMRFDDEYATMLGQGQDFFFGGFAGTGKTTVLPQVIESFGLVPDEVAFCAPTGKAAKIMGEKLRAFGINAAPTTIHKLIYLPRRANADRIQSNINFLNDQIVRCKLGETNAVFFDDRTLSLADAEKKVKELAFDLARAMENDEGPKFSLRAFEEFPENCKLIIVDEGSMVGQEIARDLASFGRPILAFGDPGQLPPVGDIHGFDCNNPDAFLTEIHRQALDNPIIRLATMAREGKDLRVADYGNGVKVVNRRNDDVTMNMEREAMVLCGTHKKRWGLTAQIRKALGFTETGPCEGEPLMFVKNSLKLPGMVNGTIVTCMTETGNLKKGQASLELTVKDSENGGTTTYDIKATQGLFEEHIERRRNAYSASSQAAFRSKKDDEHLDWAHVLTCHKSQGSQWPDVVVHDESGVFREDASKWLYTAITRAEKHLTVVQ